VKTYPEHDKLRALNGANQVVGDFLECLAENGCEICDRLHDRYGDVAYRAAFKSRDNLIAEFFEIDERELSREKDRMLEDFRQAKSHAIGLGSDL